MKGPADNGEIGDGAGARYVDVVLESDDDDEAASENSDPYDSEDYRFEVWQERRREDHELWKRWGKSIPDTSDDIWGRVSAEERALAEDAKPEPSVIARFFKKMDKPGGESPRYGNRDKLVRGHMPDAKKKLLQCKCPA